MQDFRNRPVPATARVRPGLHILKELGTEAEEVFLVVPQSHPPATPNRLLGEQCPLQDLLNPN